MSDNIKITWEGHSSSYDEVKMSKILEKVREDFKVKSKGVVKPKVVFTDTRSDSSISSLAFVNFFSKENIEKTYKDYFSDTDLDLDIDKFFDFDTVVKGHISKEVGEVQNASFEVLYVKGKNIFSYGNFERDFSLNQGLNLITSYPVNAGGKTSLLKMVPFLLYGKKMGFNNTSVRSYKSFFNYESDDDTAWIEGEIKVEDKIYYLRRDLIRKKSDSVSHNLTVKSKNVGDLDWQNENDLSSNKAMENLRKVIGSYDDYVYGSFYNLTSIKKWISTAGVERYRNVVNYLGLSIIEQKYQVATEIYKQFLETHSDVSKESIDDFRAEFEEVKEEYEAFKKALTNKKKALSKSELDKEKHDIKIQSIYEKISALNIPAYSDRFLAEQKAKKAEALNKIDNIKSKLSKLSLEDLQQEKSALEKAVGSLKADKERVTVEVDTNKIKSLENEKANFDSEKYLDEIELINSRLKKAEKIIAENEYEVKSIKGTLKDLPLITYCDNCGEETNNEDKIKSLNDRIVELKDNLVKYRKGVSSLKSKKSKLEQELKNAERKYVNDIDKKINEIKNIANREWQSKIKKVNDKFQETNNKLMLVVNQIESFELDLQYLDSLNDNLNVVENNISEYNKSLGLVQKKQELESKLKTLKLQAESINASVKQARESYYDCKGIVERLEVDFSLKKEKLNKIVIIKGKEKVYKDYIYVHSQKGLSKYILDSLFPMMNNRLKNILQEDFGFTVSMEYQKNNIKYFIKYDNQLKRPLFTVSGMEEVISSLALHYVHILLTALPKSNQLVLDEITDPINKENVEDVLKMVLKLKEIYKCVDLVSHKMEQHIATNYADNHIHTVKVNGISKIA